MSWHTQRHVGTSSAERLSPGSVDREAIARGVSLILAGIGENLDREGIRETPTRVAEAYADLFAGIGVDPVTILKPLPGERGAGLVMVRDIAVASVCEHHLMPFVGKVAVAYLPGDDGRVCGISKLARVVEVLARRPQVQERLVLQIADAVQAALDPRGVFVLCEAEHLCMTMRGARARGSTVVTTEARGLFADDAEARRELEGIARGGS